MELITGAINKRWLQNLVAHHTPECSEVRAAIAYADRDNLALLEACKRSGKPLTYYGRYDHAVPVHPDVVRWFLDQKSPNFTCRMVPDILHAKVIWWVGVGAYVGSANMTDRAWVSNIEAGTFTHEEDMAQTSMMEELHTLFDVIDARGEAIDDAFHTHLLDLKKLGKAASTAAYEFEQKAPRFFPKGAGLASIDRQSAAERGYREFERRWRESLQILRDIAAHLVLESNRPAWIPADTPTGAQADQFIHAYYYRFVRGDRGSEYVEAAFTKNRANPAAALKEALAWWKAADFDYEGERNTLLNWAPQLQTLLAKEKLPTLSREEFATAMSMVHAFGDYASKQDKVELGLAADNRAPHAKAFAHADRLWQTRTETGHKPLEVFQYVIWGPDAVERRIWNAARTSEWRLPWLQFSTWGEIVGWARADEYPPRNERTLKGLRALGYPVRSV